MDFSTILDFCSKILVGENIPSYSLFPGCQGQKVHRNPDPEKIGKGGGVVTIYGEGFSPDTFSQFNATKGNKIYFTNDFERLECINPVEKVRNFLMWHLEKNYAELYSW